MLCLMFILLCFMVCCLAARGLRALLLCFDAWLLLDFLIVLFVLCVFAGCVGCLCCVVLSWLCAVVANFVGLPVGLFVVWVFGVVV